MLKHWIVGKPKH